MCDMPNAHRTNYHGTEISENTDRDGCCGQKNAELPHDLCFLCLTGSRGTGMNVCGKDTQRSRNELEVNL